MNGWPASLSADYADYTDSGEASLLRNLCNLGIVNALALLAKAKAGGCFIAPRTKGRTQTSTASARARNSWSS